MTNEDFDNASLDPVERQLAAVRPQGAPAELRGVVLAASRRELRTERWDRRLARAAVVLLVVGFGMNASIGGRSDRLDPGRFAAGPSQESLVEVAVSVAEATNATTGSRFAQRLAQMSGRELSVAEVAMIDAAVGRISTNRSANGHEG